MQSNTVSGIDVSEDRDVDGGAAGDGRQREVELAQGQADQDDQVPEGAEDAEQELSGDRGRTPARRR